MKLNIHQLVAIFWIVVSPIIFAPLLEIEIRPEMSALLAWGIVLVTIMIALVPLLLEKWPLFRGYFC